MPDSQEQSWSDDPNAPKITHYLYFREKAGFAGYLIGSILYGTLKVPPPMRPPIRAHFVRSVCTRGSHRAVLQMYSRTVYPYPPQRGAYQVGTRILYRGHVFCCDRANRDVPQQAFNFLHRQPRVLWHRERVVQSWTSRIPVFHFLRGARYCSQCYVRLE